MSADQGGVRLVEPPELPHRTSPNALGDLAVICAAGSGAVTVAIQPGEAAPMAATAVRATDRLGLAAAIAGDAGTVIAHGERGLPRVARDGDAGGGWYDVETDRGIPDAAPTGLLVAVVLARHGVPAKPQEDPVDAALRAWADTAMPGQDVRVPMRAALDAARAAEQGR